MKNEEEEAEEEEAEEEEEVEKKEEQERVAVSRDCQDAIGGKDKFRATTSWKDNLSHPIITGGPIELFSLLFFLSYFFFKVISPFR